MLLCSKRPRDFYKPLCKQEEDETDGGISSTLHSEQLPPLLRIMQSLPAIYLQDPSMLLRSGTLLKALMLTAVLLQRTVHQENWKPSYTQLKQDCFPSIDGFTPLAQHGIKQEGTLNQL